MGADRHEDSGKNDDLFGRITPGQFVRRNDVQEVIDPGHFNARLLSAAIFHRSNTVRSKNDLKPLKYNAKVANAAQKHAEAMAIADSLFHGTPGKEKILTPYDRLRNEGLRPRFSAENVAFKFWLRYQSGRPVFRREENDETVYSYELGGKPLQPFTYLDFARAIVQQWMDSPTHRENMLSKEAAELGVGCALSRAQNGPRRIYCDQDFFAPFPAEASGSND